MTDVRLIDVKWMDAALAAKLDSAGVTVSDLAAMSPQELLRKHPYVGTINAWLLTSEAVYLMNRVQAGLWEPTRVISDPEIMLRLVELERRQTQDIRGRPPIPHWPPERPLEAPVEKSVRLRRIEEAT